MVKVLNLYAGIGGNRKLWKDVEVTAVEIDPEIAKIYQKFFPDDKIVVGDAHEYLLEHFKEFDFIWSSPPCPTHSKFNNLFQVQEGKILKYPDMRLYQEIIFLKHWFKGKWVVENVVSYYEPLIKAQKSGNHYFWSNFHISKVNDEKRGIRTQDIEQKQRRRGFEIPEELPKKFRETVLNNCVLPEVGLHIFNMAFKDKQRSLVEAVKW